MTGSIASLITTNRRRGAEVQAERIAEGLRSFGWRIELMALAGASGVPTIDAEAMSYGERLPRLSIGVLLKLRRRFRSTRPDLVLANGGSTLRYAVVALAGRRTQRPAIVYVSIGEPQYWLRGRLHEFIQRSLLKRADHVVAVSAETRRQLIEMGVPADRVVVIFSGVPEDLVEIPARRPGGGVRLLFMGNLSPEKNPSEALEVLSRMHADVDVMLRFVGSGSLHEVLQEKARRLGLDHKVEFVGHVGDVAPQLEWADLLLLTSRTEGLPGAVLEAAAAAVPAVAYDVGGSRESIIDGVTGRLVPPGDIDSCVAALTHLAEADEERAALGKAARDLVRTQFLLRHTVDGYHKLLRQAMTPTSS